ncbi:MAG: TylF/MycF/NovP-related O-methyltransferase [bacterium]|nr:TylF/MycF/NovP-related O-methyltransferase [bacterium]
MKTNCSQPEINLAEEREKFLKSVKPEEIADNFPLFITRQELARYLIRYELFKKILNVKGSIVECGVYKGTSLMLFANLSAIFEPYALNRQVIGFDSFEGFPSVHSKDNSDMAKVNDMSDTNLRVINKSMELYDGNRPIGHIPKVILVKGDAVQTIPTYFEKNPHILVALLYLDFDIYEPTKVALKTILPRMPKGAIIAFDELNEKRWEGETAALLETFNLNNYEIKKFTEEPHISYIRL